jgi:hypothetical protein
MKKRKFSWYERITRMTSGPLSKHVLRCELTVLGEKEEDQEEYEKRKYITKKKTC